VSADREPSGASEPQSAISERILTALLVVEMTARKAIRGTAGDGTIRALGNSLRALDRERAA
jgi:hypothetical protein